MKFKGMDLGLCQYTTPCEFKDGIWFAPLSVLVGFIGGEVRKTPGKVYLDVYGHNAEFTLDSDVAQTDRGELKAREISSTYRSTELRRLKCAGHMRRATTLFP